MRPIMKTWQRHPEGEQFRFVNAKSAQCDESNVRQWSLWVAKRLDDGALMWWKRIEQAA